MEPIKKQFVFDENNRKIAVQIDLKTFEKIETILEDYALEQLIKKNSHTDIFDLVDAEEFYSKLDKA